MVLLNFAAVFGLQVLCALATAIPADPESFDLQIDPEALFAPGTVHEFDPSLSIPQNESIFNAVRHTSIDADFLNEKRNLNKRNAVTDWQDVDVQGCWALGSTNEPAFFSAFLQLQAQLRNNGRIYTTIGPHQYWEYVAGNLRLRVRNQHACQTYKAYSDEMAAIMQALWYRCTDTASGWALYTFQSSSGTVLAYESLVLMVLPAAFTVPDPPNTTC